MALAWGLGFFLLGGLLLGLAGLQTRAEISAATSTVTTSLLTDFGFDADTLADLTVSDPSGITITADDIADVVAASAAASRAQVSRQVLLTLPVLAVVAGVAGWWLASRTIRPITAMTAHARRVSSDTLDTRIDLHGPDDELKQLADEFDSMMERLEHAFNAQQQFAASASHELRTPLTVIRTELDVALDVPNPTPDDLADMGDAIRHALDRSERTIDSLLALASSGIAQASTQVDLAQIVEKCLDDTARQRAAGRITVHRTGDSTATVRGDPALLDRMVGNLVQNATLHNTEDGTITIDLGVNATDVTLTITNTGRVLTSVERLGEPFYRGDGSGDRPGSGLGLLVADSIARAHRGHITLSPNQGGGLVVHLRLPTQNHSSTGHPDTTSSHRFVHRGALTARSTPYDFAAWQQRTDLERGQEGHGREALRRTSAVGTRALRRFGWQIDGGSLRLLRPRRSPEGRVLPRPWTQRPSVCRTYCATLSHAGSNSKPSPSFSGRGITTREVQPSW